VEKTKPACPPPGDKEEGEEQGGEPSPDKGKSC